MMHGFSGTGFYEPCDLDAHLGTKEMTPALSNPPARHLFGPTPHRFGRLASSMLISHCAPHSRDDPALANLPACRHLFRFGSLAFSMLISLGWTEADTVRETPRCLSLTQGVDLVAAVLCGFAAFPCAWSAFP